MSYLLYLIFRCDFDVKECLKNLEEFGELNTTFICRGKEGAASSGLVLRLETDDVNAAAVQAAAAGGAPQGEVTEDGCGLGATLVDPFGVTWVLGSSTSAKKCA